MTVPKVFTAFPSAPGVLEGTKEANFGIDIADIWRILRRRKAVIFGTVALCVAITVLTLSVLTPLYTATAFVMLDQRQTNVTTTNAVVPELLINNLSIQNQVQILQSRNLAARVIEKLELGDTSEFNPQPAPWYAKIISRATLSNWFSEAAEAIPLLSWFSEAEEIPIAPPTPDNRENAVVSMFLGKLSVTIQGLSSGIAISFRSENAQQAALIANTIATTYVQDQRDQKLNATEKASEWLGERLEKLSSQTQASERAVEQYKATHNLTDTAVAGTSVVQQQLGALNIQLTGAQADLAQQEAKYNQVTLMKDAGRAAALSQVLVSPLIMQLRQQEAELFRQEAELTNRYGPLHPKVIDLASQKENLSAKIDEEAQRIIGAVASDLEVARARVRSLQDNLRAVTGLNREEGLARVKLSELTAVATSDRALYDTFLSRFKEIQGQEMVQAPEARIISPAVTPTSPSFPKKIAFIGAAIPGGLVLGIILALLSYSMAGGFRTQEQVENFLALPVLASIPEVRRRQIGGKKPADLITTKVRSSFAESVRGLQLNLTLANNNTLPRIVLITSPVPSEGKTTVAVSLARTAARGGLRVIVVDADLRHPAVAKTLGVTKHVAGLADVLAGSVSIDNALTTDSLSSVRFLSAGSKVDNPSDLIASERMALCTKMLSVLADVVIIDAPPLLPVNDSKFLARLAEAVIFVVRWERTPRTAALHALRSLTDVMASVAGVVFTRADWNQVYHYSLGKPVRRSFRKYYQH